jgi:hypothetical protein
VVRGVVSASALTGKGWEFRQKPEGSMHVLRRIVAVPLLAIALVASSAAPAGAVDNVALAINTKNDFYKWKTAFQVTRVDDDVVDDSNVAWAESSCERCRAAAVAVQIVLITGNPHTVTPANLAVARNVNCLLCRTYAGAWQFVVTTNQPIHFTEAGNATIDAVRQRVQELVETAEFGPTEDEVADLAKIDALNAAIDAEVARLEAVLENEIVRVGGGRLRTLETTDLAG